MNTWQLDLIEKLQGYKPKEMIVFASSRQVGKSHFMKMWSENYYSEFPSLELSEGTVLGHPYYIVRPKGIPWYEMEPWCRETFGPTPEFGVWELDARWYMNAERFWFRDEKDRMLFVLRWSR